MKTLTDAEFVEQTRKVIVCLALELPDSVYDHASAHFSEALTRLAVSATREQALAKALGTAVRALSAAEWNCAPGSTYCPVCQRQDEPTVPAWPPYKAAPAGHTKQCLLGRALAEARALLAGSVPVPTRESERAALIAEVGDCCCGADPFCASGCLVEIALRKRGVARPGAA